MKQRTILVVEDEAGIRMALEDRLGAAGYRVSACADGLAGEAAGRSQAFDLIILDLLLPGQDGLTVCDKLRAAKVATPILMLTALSGAQDVVDGLRRGADDYLAKPFDMAVLLARIEAILRRSAAAAPPPACIEFGPFRLDGAAGELRRGDATLPLNAQEFRLLSYLAANPGRLLERAEILEKVWGYDDGTSTRTIDVHIAKLRHHLGESDRPRHILTFRGRGYKFAP